MNAAATKLLPALLLPLFAWRIYRRFRRNVGQQPLHPRRLITGIVLFAVISALVVLASRSHPPVLMGYALGLLVGMPLAFLGLHLTHFQTTERGHFYTPNTYLGVALTLLLVGRVAYRVATVYVNGALPASNPGSLFQGSLTLAMLGLTAGYFITYNSGVLWKGARQKPGQAE